MMPDPLRVLVVDDEVALAEVVSGYLSGKGSRSSRHTTGRPRSRARERRGPI